MLNLVPTGTDTCETQQQVQSLQGRVQCFAFSRELSGGEDCRCSLGSRRSQSPQLVGTSSNQKLIMASPGSPHQHPPEDGHAMV